MRAWLKFLENDLRILVRTPENLWAMLLFGLLVLVVVQFSVPPEMEQSLFMGSSALMLAVLFSSVLGLPPLQHHPGQVGFLPNLLTGNMSPVGYFWEKFTVGLIMMFLNSLTLFPATVILFNFPVSSRLLGGYFHLLLAVFGISLVVTLGSALTVGREPWLLPVLVFPLLFPVILSASRLIQGAVSARSTAPDAWIHLLISYDLLMLFGSWFLAEFLWEDLPELY